MQNPPKTPKTVHYQLQNQHNKYNKDPHFPNPHWTADFSNIIITSLPYYPKQFTSPSTYNELFKCSPKSILTHQKPIQ